MKQQTLVARLAWAQTLVTLAALALVIALTWSFVSAMFTWHTDRQLRDLLARTLDYLDAGSPGVAIDWDWLAREIDESRPREVRFEVRRAGESELLIALGRGQLPLARRTGCHDHGSARVCAIAGQRYLASAASDRANDHTALRELLIALLVACGAAALAVLVGSRWVTLRAIRPVSELAERIAAIEPGSGAELVVKAGLPELTALERRFAEMVARYEESVQRERRFAAQASHELRTPLTLARAEIEALAARVEGAEAALHALLELEGLIDALLWFARAQAPLDRERLELVNLADVLLEQLDALRRRQVQRELHARLPDEALVRGDERLLASAISNLLENALKHGDDTAIDVELENQAGALLLRVANGGASVPEHLREDIFIPFVRGQHAGPGFGLGLPFARAVARAHAGDVTLENSARGTTVQMTLPLVGWQARPS